MASPEPSPSWLAPYATPSPLELSTGTELPIFSYLFQLALVTVIFVGFAYMALKFLKDRVPGLGIQLPGARGIRVVDRVIMDQARSAFIVNVGKRYWLLAASGDHITTVAELAREDVEQDFDQLVEKETKRRETP